MADANGNKPLHIVAQQVVKLARVITVRGEPNAPSTADERDADLLTRYCVYVRALLLLVDGGAHYDAVNERGESPISILRENRLSVTQADALANGFAKQLSPSTGSNSAARSSESETTQSKSALLSALFSRETLQCLAARVIRRNKIDYASRVPAHLVAFVNVH